MVGLPFLLRLCAFSRSVFTTARDVAGRRIFLATWLPGYLATWLPGYLATGSAIQPVITAFVQSM